MTDPSTDPVLAALARQIRDKAADRAASRDRIINDPYDADQAAADAATTTGKGHQRKDTPR